MIPKKHRVRTSEFRTAARKSKAFHSPNLTLRVHHRNSESVSVAVVVSGKVSKKSVTRNLLRRRAYTALSKNLSRIKKGTTLLFYLKKTAADLSYGNLKDEMQGLLRLSGVLSDTQ